MIVYFFYLTQSSFPRYTVFHFLDYEIHVILASKVVSQAYLHA